ncbi:hypothetical protein PTKIN_Ptkin13bG0192800 [Pterospermum kingtungense]
MGRWEPYQAIDEGIASEQIGFLVEPFQDAKKLKTQMGSPRLDIAGNREFKEGLRLGKGRVVGEGVEEGVLGVRGEEREEEGFGLGEFVMGKEGREEGEEERRGRGKGREEGKGEFVEGKEGGMVGGKGRSGNEGLEKGGCEEMSVGSYGIDWVFGGRLFCDWLCWRPGNGEWKAEREQATTS